VSEAPSPQPTSAVSGDSDILGRAQQHHRLGDYKNAEELYRRISKADRNNVIAKNNLVAILIESTRYVEARLILEDIVRSTPHYADALANMAACEGHLANWHSCLRWCKKAVAVNRGNPMPHLWLARVTGETQGIGEKIEALRKAIGIPEVQPKDALVNELVQNLIHQGERKEALSTIRHWIRVVSRKDCLLKEAYESAEATSSTRHFYRAISAAFSQADQTPEISYWQARKLLSAKGGDEKSAVEMLLSVVKSQPGHSDAWLELGIILRRQGNVPKALACLHRAAKEDPRSLQPWRELVDTHLENGESRAAIRESSRMIKSFRYRTEAIVAHCYTLIDCNRWRAAIKILEGYSSKKPENKECEILNCIGTAYTRGGDYLQSISAFKKALRTFGSDAALWNNRGMAHGLARRHRSEIHCYRRAVAVRPEDPGSHVNLAMARLAQGDFLEGLQEYEWRLKAEKGSLNLKPTGRIIAVGEEPEKLLVVTEQGLGDTLQFVRYLHDLRELLPDTKITLACPDKLSKLLRTSLPCVDEVCSCELSDLDNRDTPYIPLMSLPYFCRINPYESCSPSPYLRIDRSSINAARSILREGVESNNIIVGINWKGNPRTERTNLRGRSMTLEDLAPLADLLPNAAFVSLQKVAGSEELAECSFRNRFIRNQSTVSEDWCFVKTAAYILGCDHVVTTDTSIAHLAGALGHSTHLLLAAKPEWRWSECAYSHRWYEAMQIHRQARHGDWRKPVECTAESIHRAAKHTNVGSAAAQAYNIR